MASRAHSRSNQVLCLLNLKFLVCLAFAAAQNAAEPCYTDSSGWQRCGNLALPHGVCLWTQGNSHHNVSTGETRPQCDFELLDEEFLEVLGRSPKIEFISNAPAHEGGVYFPDKEEFYFSSTWTLDDLPAKLMKLSLTSGEISAVFTSRMANGMALDNNGELVVCEQGLHAEVGFIQRVNLYGLNTSIVADNWSGLPFNSPNDVVVKRDNSIWFTDPDYGWVEKFKGPPKISNQVYRVSPSGTVEAVADGFVKPNGLAFSPDEKLLYVTDTGSSVGDGTVDITKPHSITVFDVEIDGATLTNRRVFASVANLDGSYPGIGVPDGVKVDQEGRVYTANQDGIQVFNSQGKLLGLIRVQGAVNMGFAGHKLDRMIILNGTAIHSVQLNVQAAGLFYAHAHLHL